MSPDNNQRNDLSTIKNNNPDWHWLNAGNICRICGSCETSLTLHYVNVHPNSEVVSSRIAPELTAFLRSPEYVPECEVVNSPHSRYRQYKQICYFCNELKIYNKSDWIHHMIKHTGYYTKQCDRCSKKLPKDSRYHHHQCDGNIQRIRQPQFDEIDLIAFVCKLCNFLRFDEKAIRKHLRNEHEHQGNHDMEDFEDITLLTFPNHSLPRRFDGITPTLDEDRMVNIKQFFHLIWQFLLLNLNNIGQLNYRLLRSWSSFSLISQVKNSFFLFCIFQELRKKNPTPWTVEESLSSNGELICTLN